MFKLIRRILVLLFLLFVGYKTAQVYQNVKQVMTYRSVVREVLAEQDTQANEELILAMIYTETKGQSVDLMQSSESISGQTNTITDNKTSIRQGIQTLSDNLNKATSANVDAWTAVQAYNFGSGYIDYVSQNGGENTLDVAKTYSKEVVAPSLGNLEGQTYFYLNPIALLNGAELYVNGGNYYYSRQVQLNLYIMKLMNWF
ncbi:Pneumococcal vaccine antigen A-like protein [Streptococcus sp. DD10]|uniref:lysozyme family protein n=1 Tax=Streptococcus sp. DD10 TaxID=1777878 RepID=UPI00079395D0|nr:lysozyme family protein [Streptococcus sp. DD10]KXT76349.1 Pneumococcal vaccine antigen A-like protein [Streptococcus sp. DD10]